MAVGATPVCGEVETHPGQVYDVRAEAWDVTCEDAMSLANDLVAGQVDEYRPGGAGDVRYTLVLHGRACTVFDSLLNHLPPTPDPIIPASIRDCAPDTGQSEPPDITFHYASGPDD